MGTTDERSDDGVKYEYGENSATVTFSIAGEEYTKEVKITEGKVLQGLGYWRDNQDKVTKTALSRLMKDHKHDLEVYRAMEKLHRSM